MLDITDIFNTREIAIGMMVCLFILFAIYKDRKILESFGIVIKSFFNIRIIIPILFMFFYSLGMVYLLNKIGLWENHQIKNFIYWLIAVGILTHFKKDAYNVKSVIKDTVSLIAIFQFILTFYTFNLFFEILFIFMTTVCILVKTLSEGEDDMKNITKIANFILSTFGFIMLLLSINKYITNFNEFSNSKTLYDFFVPTFLSIMIIPYFYIFFMIVRYESALISLNFAIKNNEKLKKYAKMKGMLAFNFDSKSFERWCKNLISYDLNKKTINESIQDIKKINKVKKNIHKIDIKKGWHPFIADEFLKNYNIVVKEYRKSFSGIWSGSSNCIFISEENSNIHYRIEGEIDCVNRLQVELFFYFKNTNIEKSYNTFVNICNDLAIKSLGYPLTKEIVNTLIGEDNLERKFYEKRIEIKHEIFETGAYKLVFIIY